MPFAMSAPAIGTFIRPVGQMYAYCYEVVKVLQADKGFLEQWTCKRWGMDDNHQPVKDGHQDTRYLSSLKEVLPGVWRDVWEHTTPRWGCCPLYYRKMTPKGQQDLFI